MADSPEETNVDSTNEQPNDSSQIEAKRPRRALRMILVLIVLVVVGVVGLVLKTKLEPIDVRQASKAQAVGWLAMRDLSKETPETREQLLKLYLDAAPVPNADGAGAAKVELPESVKKLSNVFLNGRDKKIEQWSRDREAPPYLRLDYVVVPKKERSGKYVCSKDVKPGPALLARRQKSQERDVDVNVSFVEKNVRLLAMQWFVVKYKEYDDEPDETKPQKLEQIADELTRLRDMFGGLVDARQKNASLVKLLREFEATTDGWNKIATAEETAKALWFKDLLTNVVARKTYSVKFLSIKPPVAVFSKPEKREDVERP